MQSAAKVGALVVVFVVLLFLAFSMLGRSVFGATRDTYYAEFQDVTGVRAGTPVLIAGVKKGEVSSLQLVDAKTAKLTLEMDQGTRIPVGSSAVIPSSLIGIGENPVAIEPPEEISPEALPVGSTIPGKKANALDNILPEGRETVKELTATLKAARTILEDRRLMNRIDALLASTDKTMQQFGGLAARADALMGANQGNLTLALQRVNTSLADVNRITRQVAIMAEDPKLKNNAVAILEQVRQTTVKVNRLVGDVATMVNDPELREPLRKSIQNVAEMTETGKRIADNAERMTANGAVISEKAIGVTDQVSGIVSQASDIATDVKSLTNRVSNILNPKPRPGALSQLEVGMDLFRETNPGYWRADFSGSIPFRDNTLHFGLWDAFESNKLTLQLGSKVDQRLGYRYGIFAGNAGVGVDYQVAPRVSLRSDFWNLNDPRADLRARYDFGNGLIGWLGVDRLFKDNAPTIGIGVRR
jgi:phospholipid/cholesterol/gamma-HCH transport system substrate-binding protein